MSEDPTYNKKLISLAENNMNASVSQAAMLHNTPVLNGIACPKCGKELFDSNTLPGYKAISYHPMKDIHCNNCEFRGYRLSY
jgi:hypothetical protein